MPSSDWLESIRLNLLDEMRLPDFKGRHLFVARLRLIIYILSWFLFIVFYPRIWGEVPLTPLIFNLGFLLTAICYWNILHEKRVLLFSFLELLADVISQTTIIYILGADGPIVFLFYGLYVIAAGSFFGYLTALIAATSALICYFTLIIFLQSGFISPFVYPNPISVSTEGFGYFFNLFFLPVALGVIVYGTKISHYFSTIKEQALETRNIQLTALNRIGSVIRRAIDLQSVIDQVLKGVTQGLGFDVCVLALLDTKEEEILFFMPRGNRLTVAMEETLGHGLGNHSLPLGTKENAIYQSIVKNRVIIRNDMMELMRGLVPEVRKEKIIYMQNEGDLRKFVITPLVAESQVVGALIGASSRPYVEESMIDTLDHFANQAAMALETAQLIEELKKKNIELEEANKIKSDFLAIMSHELRTPLTAIIGFTEILLDQVLGQLNQEQEDSLSEVLKNAENLLQLINSILELAKVEAGKLEITKESFSFEELVKEVKQTVSPLLSQKDHHLLIKVSPNLPKAYADPRKLRQVLLNLVGNAIKFTPNDGKIQISVDYFRKADVLKKEFQLDSKDFAKSGVFRVSVKDSGIGIKKEHIENIFDIFQQVDSTFTRKYQGTGLGLALSKQLVELHEGKIVVESEFGKGADFKFLIPDLSNDKKHEEISVKESKETMQLNEI